MKNKILIFCFIVFFSCKGEKNPEPIQALFSGKDINELNYNGINANRYVNFFTDLFTNNSSNWYIGNNSDGRFSVENGYYYCQSISSSDRRSYSGSFTLWDTAKNFEIELSVRVVQGNQMCGFNWGYRYEPNVIIGAESYYYFYFDRNAKIKIGKSVSDKESDYSLQPLANNQIKVNDYNKITIRKMNNKYYFFINEKIASIQDFEPFFDKRVAFTVGSNSTCYFDYVKIRYIN